MNQNDILVNFIIHSKTEYKFRVKIWNGNNYVLSLVQMKDKMVLRA